MRMTVFTISVALTASCQAPVKAQRNWDKPTYANVDGDMTPTGWKGSATIGLSPAPGDPTAPMFLRVTQKGKVEGAAAFANAMRVAKITGAKNVATFQQQAVGLIPGFETSKSWASGGMVTINGVPHALFASTVYGGKSNETATQFYRTPVRTLQAWGGLKYYIQATGLTDVFERFGPKDWAANNMTPTEHAKTFVDVYDGWIVGMAEQNQQIQQGTLDMMKGINKDWATRADCAASQRCTYVPGGTPGSATARYE